MPPDPSKTSSRKTEPVFYTTAEAARVLKMSAAQVRNLIKQGKLAAQKDGGQYRVLHKDVFLYLQTRTN